MQADPAATLPAVQLSVSVKSTESLILMEVSVSATEPVLVTVSVCALLAVLTGWLAKVSCEALVEAEVCPAPLALHNGVCQTPRP